MSLHRGLCGGLKREQTWLRHNHTALCATVSPHPRRALCPRTPGAEPKATARCQSRFFQAPDSCMFAHGCPSIPQVPNGPRQSGGTEMQDHAGTFPSPFPAPGSRRIRTTGKRDHAHWFCWMGGSCLRRCTRLVSSAPPAVRGAYCCGLVSRTAPPMESCQLS